MSNNQHTPGPWKHTGGFDRYEEIYSANGVNVAQMHSINFAQRKADARLIAAAPELLEALRVMVGFAESDDFDGAPSLAALRNAQAAIRKAEGGKS